MITSFVTGGSRGIGAAIVRALAKHGNVAFTRHTSEAAARALEAEFPGGGVKAFECDVRDPEALRATAEQVRARFGAPSVVVNSAGIALRALFQDTTEEHWRDIFAVNFDAARRVTKLFLPDMISRRRGAVINISSVWGSVGASCEVAYSASKAALEGFTRALAKEVAPSGVRVNAVAPGVVDTDMMKGYSAEDAAAIADSLPLGRMATPEEIASAVDFLVMHEYITGQVLTVDGGFAL